MNERMLVVPPPRSRKSTPRSFSSWERTAREAASASSTSSVTRNPARLTLFRMFWADDTEPVMMCTSDSRRTPIIPTGFLIPDWSSTMNSCGMTCRMARSMGTTMALAASTTRSTSSLTISRPLPVTATTPRELTPSMWAPEIPTVTASTSRPDINSAASTACTTDLTVDSMLMITPRRKPREGYMPTPVISRTPVSLNWPITAHTLVVPISSPTRISSCANLLLPFPVVHGVPGTEIDLVDVPEQALLLHEI